MRILRMLCGAGVVLGASCQMQEELAAPVAVLTVSCTDDACRTLLLHGGESIGEELEYTWYRDMVELEGAAESLEVGAEELGDVPFAVRVGNRGGYDWVQLQALPPAPDADGNLPIIDTPIPILSVKSGTCAVGSMIFTPTTRVGGCLTDMEAVGLSWDITGVGAARWGHSMMAPGLTWVGAMEEGGMTYPGSPTGWYAEWRVGGWAGASAPLTAARPGWVVPTPLNNPAFGPSSDFFSNWLYGEPGDTFVGDWKGTATGVITPPVRALDLYRGLGVLPRKHSPHFEVSCPLDLKTQDASATEANLPVVTWLSPSSDPDGDGYVGSFDCDETDAGIHEGAPETLCDGVDSNCDGLDQLTDDMDGDGWPAAACDPNGGDCDDRDPLVAPDQPEVAGNGVDDDCDGKIDET